MKRLIPLTLALLALSQPFRTVAQTLFVGNNQPGTGSSFVFTPAVGATNLALVVTNSSTAFSHLYLKRGGVASLTNYDFVSRLDRTTNSVNLEPPELVGGANYGLWVFTPTNSAAHAFTVSLTTNRADARLASMPILKPLAFSVTGTVAAGGAQYFQVDVPTNLPGWRVVLTSSGTADADVYVQRGVLPSQTSYLKRSTDRGIDTVFLDSPEATNATYFISVLVPSTDVGSATYTLGTEIAPVANLTWEPGTTASATTAFTNQSALGGDYFFKITTINADWGAWRTRLDVQSGEADLFLRPTNLPTPTLYSFSSTQPGSDGLVLLTNQFKAGQVWYAMVTATPGSQWSVYSGNLFITPLPAPAAEASSGTNTVIAAEGMNFYRFTLDSNTIAWRLGLGGLTNNLFVHQGAPAFTNSASYYEWKQSGQMLVVPPYLKSGTEYFVTVVGSNTQPFTLDSRQQPIIEFPFGSATNVAASDYGYVTFHVQVPPYQIAWQVDLLADTGDPAIAVRQATVANEYISTAVSATTNAPFETFTLVPPTLTDGSYYLTVWGTPPFTATLTNSRPVITPVDYAFSITNDLPNRQGWRFYSVTNIVQQGGSLGWELLLNNYLPGTELAVRRNAVPGRWAYRTNYTQGSSSAVTTLLDASSAKGFLQMPRHPADIWYIGVNNTNQALGPFVLTGREIPRPDLTLGTDFSTNRVTDQLSGRFQYFHIDVPTNALGLELQLANVTSGDPRLVVCRGELPVSLSTWLVNSNTWTPNTSTHWPVGAQVAYNTDWTGFTTDATGASEQGRFFFASQGNPLEAGVYYVGIINATANTNEMNYDLVVRGIFLDGTVTDVPFSGSNSGSGLAPHRVAWHRVTVPPNAPSWNLGLDLGLGAGDGFFVCRKDGLPNYGATAGAASSPTNLVGCLVRKKSDEHFLLLPNPPDTNVNPGTYYFGVVAEGLGPTGTRAGSNTCEFTFASQGPLKPLSLGTVDPLGQTGLVMQTNQDGGEILGYQFTVLTNTPVIEVRLTNRVANPWMSLRADGQYGRPNDTAYGNLGGWPAAWSDANVIRVPWPVAGVYSLLVQAAGTSGNYTNASYRLEVAAQSALTPPFDGGSIAITNQSPYTWNYFLVRVPSDALGWDLRLTNILKGDPRLVVCRTNYPFNLTTRTATGGSWTPYTATNWPAAWQIAPDLDWTGYRQSAVGSNQAGTVFMAAMGNPLEPGDYVVGVASGTTGTGSNPMSYTLVSRGIGANYSIPVTPLAFSGGQGSSTSTPPREVAYYRVDVPNDSPSWQVHLDPTIGDDLLLIRKDGLPNFGAALATAVTNLAGCKLQKLGDEQFVLLPVPPSNSIPAGTYYLGVVSEGQSPSGTKIGSSTSAYTLQSIGNLPVTDLGTVDPSYYFEQYISQAGGSALALQFTVPPNIPEMGPVVVRLDNRTGNPAETIRGGTVLPSTLENYGRQGGWLPDWSNPSYNRVDSAIAGGTYSVFIQAEALAGLYPDATYTLRIYSLAYYSIPLAFDGGRSNIVGHAAGEWLYFTVDVPPDAIGWDLRLTNIISGSPRLVACRSGWPSDLTSRLPSGNPWSWGAATNWPAGAQAAPGIDWTGYRYDINPFDPRGTNLIDTTGTVFAAGMGSPLEPGRYIVGVSSAPGSSSPMSYTIASRGIGPGFLVPVSQVSTGYSFVGATGLSPREPAYYSIVVPTNTPLWKLRLAPSAGDALLAIRKDALPNVTATNNLLASGLGGGHRFQKGGGENALLGEVTGQTNVPAGTYYVAVIGEGATSQPAKGIIGTGTTDFTFTSALPSPATDLGNIVPGAADVVVTNTLEPGETAAYQFTMLTNALNHTIRLENVTGTPLLRLRNDQHVPLDVSSYGQDGNFVAMWTGLTNVINNPGSGLYSLSVLANGVPTNWPPLQYTLRIHAEPSPSNLCFDGCTVPVNNQGNGWRVFAVTVPADAMGWDLRLLNVSNGEPRLVIRRDQAPTNYISSGVSFSSTTWPTLAQLAPTNDWTQLNESDGVSSTGRVFEVGMGNPLQPGTYYVGITNLDSAHAASYTVQSRGIGSGFSVAVKDLQFALGSATEILPAREAAWYRLVVPNNAPSWKVALNFDAGDGLLMAQRNALPNVAAASANILANITGGKKMQKIGDEHLLCLASSAGASLTPGTYYLGVVSEGLNPSNAVSRIGSGSAAFTLYSDGSLPPLDLGWLGLEDLVGQAALGGGECETWRFTVPPGILALQVAFDPAQTTGNPVLTMTTRAYPPAALGYPLAAPTRYGAEGGVTVQPQWALTNVLTSVITIPNPVPNDFSITVQAAGSGFNYPDADVKFRVRSLPIPELNFDAALNTNGLANSVEGVLQDGFRDYWLVQVPYTMNGQPVLGWKLDLSALYGTPKMRVRRGTLPDDTAGGGTSTTFLRQAVLVPDYLSPGTWYIEVTASGLTDYTLTSEALALTHPAWQMPAPGLPFGDTGAVDLEQDSSHYYAVTVPPGNGGLLRTELDAISGNPNLYLRYKAPPTVSHNATGASGAIYDRVLTNTFTEYGNWVALDGKSEVGLPPGTYYLAVHAGGGANVRYRLLLSTGAVADLGFAGGSLSGQNLAGGDWRYYRVQLPVDMPVSWTIGVSTERGSIAVYLRDTIPPGQGTNATDLVDWSQDNKNQGPYPWFTNAGNYTLTVPAVRPGEVYFVGVRALSDASFTVSSTPGTHLIDLDGVIPFTGGSVTNQVPPGGVLRYRIDVPGDALTWSHTAIHASSVRLYLEQGTLPTMTLADHWYSSGANSAFNASLADSSWPWLPGYRYYLAVVNLSDSAQPFSFHLNGTGANPSPVISAPSVSPAGTEFIFSVTGSIGESYRVLVSSDLVAGSWLVYTNFVQGSPTQVLKLPIEPNYLKRFYRIVSP